MAEKNADAPWDSGKTSYPLFLPWALTADEIAAFYKNPYDMFNLARAVFYAPDKEPKG